MRPMRTNLEYFTDDELVLETMDLLKLMMKENNTQTIIMIFSNWNLLKMKIY